MGKHNPNAVVRTEANGEYLTAVWRDHAGNRQRLSMGKRDAVSDPDALAAAMTRAIALIPALIDSGARVSAVDVGLALLSRPADQSPEMAKLSGRWESAHWIQVATDGQLSAAAVRMAAGRKGSTIRVRGPKRRREYELVSVAGVYHDQAAKLVSAVSANERNERERTKAHERRRALA